MSPSHTHTPPPSRAPPENFQEGAQLGRTAGLGVSHLVKSPPHPHEDLSSDSQPPHKSQAWWHTSVTSVLGMQRGGALEFIEHPP